MKIFSLIAALFLTGDVCAAEPADMGRSIFAARCAGCHAVAPPAGDKWRAVLDAKAPGLENAGARFQRGFLTAWLARPVPLRPAGYPFFRRVVTTAQGDRLLPAPVKDHPALAGADLEAVVGYLTSLGGTVPPYPLAKPAETISPHVLYEKIFACAGCHARSSDDASRTGSTLAGIAERLSPAWLGSYLHDPQYWGAVSMPRLRMRSDQLAALLEYLAAPVEPAATGAAAHEEIAGKPPAPVDTTQRAAMIYRVICSQCHGVNGDGRGANARFLAVEPRNHRSGEEMRKLSDEHLYRVIRYGGASVNKSSLMPAWGSVLDDAEVKEMVAYLRELSNSEKQDGHAK
ncbi:MAG TPA: c-type cytochrome [Noviherbaspirillum sp.]